jgi:mono/diheme cytochrome c family protein
VKSGAPIRPLLASLLAVALATWSCEVVREIFPQRSPGERLWRKHCARCHGLDGAGNIPPYNGNPWTDLLDDDFKYGETDGDVKAVIQEGAFGQGEFSAMPANPDLTDTQIREIVDYLRQLRGESY